MERMVVDLATGAITIVPMTEAEILAAIPPPPTREEMVARVKGEAQRRIMALMGVTTFDACVVKQLNANSRATELVDLAIARALTPAEASEADALRAMRAAIVAIRAKSNDLEAMPSIPGNYANDAYWL